MELKSLRIKVDDLDEKLLKLLNQRAKEVLKINKLKEQDNLQLYSAEREAHILKRLRKLNKGPLSSEDLDMLFREVLSVCRSLRKSLRVAYLGPQGTFTHMAAIKKFGKKPVLVAADSISDVFDRVEKGEADYGVVPIENSIEGVVNYTLDMFFVSDLKICSEVTLGISHSLLAVSGKKISRIYSHPQVFPQCRKWIAQEYPNAELIQEMSTAKAAQAAKMDPEGACIGNKVLAEIYGLKVVTSSIEDAVSNTTRFLVIAKNDARESGDDKTSILFSLKDRVGVLHDMLYSFKKYGINLTKIESRPSKKKLGEYYFFIDFQGHRSSGVFTKVLKDLEKTCNFVKVLGSYPKES